MAEPGDEAIDWQATMFAGNRLRQHMAFRALSFRDKARVLEELGEVAALFGTGKAAGGERERGKKCGNAE